MLAAVFIAALAVLAGYGLLGWYTLYLYGKVRQRVQAAAEADDDAVLGGAVSGGAVSGGARRRGGRLWSLDDLPPVTVQIPVYNELLVVERAIGSACALDYPRQRLQIQVIDDSTDRTTDRAASLVRYRRAAGVKIEIIHRDHREGFKAGALAHALETATGEYIALFDADFEPPPDFLRRTIACFEDDPCLGLVQGRWTHSNRSASLLTAAQAMSIDRHFAIDQTVRFGADYFPKFNGSAGVWRRACIEDAGGWRGDTLCEDLCLSTRAFLKGWRFRLLPQVTAPAEIPTSIFGFKNQQARWAQGSVQCLLKYGRDILRAHDRPLAGRLYALLIMSGYITALMPILMLLSLVPLIALGWTAPPALSLLLLAAASQPILYTASQRALYRDWPQRMVHLVTLLIVGLGMSPAVTRGVARAVTGRASPFLRTVKGHEGWKVYPVPYDWLQAAEQFLLAYAVLGLVVCARQQVLRPVPFLLACVAGYGYVSLTGARERVASYAAAEGAKTRARRQRHARLPDGLAAPQSAPDPPR